MQTPAYNGPMLSLGARRHLAVVLVGARNPQNIGAAARAMQDFGFDDLRIVNSFAPPFEAAQLEAKSAVRAETIMQSARLFGSLPEAIGDCSMVVGTTAVGERGLLQPLLPLQEAASLLVSHLEACAPAETSGADDPPPAASHGGGVALLFGSEKTGLTREQLSFCSVLLTIPLLAPEGRHLSMNLGQAVAVCLYELSRSGFEGSREIPRKEQIAATESDRERLLTLVLETLSASGYSRRFPANARQEVVRQLVQGLAQSRDEAATWMGIFRQILRSLPRA